MVKYVPHGIHLSSKSFAHALYAAVGVYSIIVMGKFDALRLRADDYRADSVAVVVMNYLRAEGTNAHGNCPAEVVPFKYAYKHIAAAIIYENVNAFRRRVREGCSGSHVAAAAT